MSAAKTKALNIIDENAVGGSYIVPILCKKYVLMRIIAVFSKSYCPYCKATKSLLDSMGAKYYAIELDQVGTLTHRLSYICNRC
jgi:glutaredoxin 3